MMIYTSAKKQLMLLCDLLEEELPLMAPLSGLLRHRCVCFIVRPHPDVRQGRWERVC